MTNPVRRINVRSAFSDFLFQAFALMTSQKPLWLTPECVLLIDWLAVQSPAGPLDCHSGSPTSKPLKSTKVLILV